MAKTIEYEHDLRVRAEIEASHAKKELTRWKGSAPQRESCYWMTTEDGEVEAECCNWHLVEGVDWPMRGNLPEDWEFCPYCGGLINGMG